GCAWQNFIDQLCKAQLQPVALAPLGAGQLDEALPPSLPVLRWSPDAKARPEHPRGRGQPVPAGLDDLLAMVAATRRVDPPLLRALRRINPQQPLNAGLEGALWCHADVQAGFSACMRSEAEVKHLRRFAERSTDLQIRVEQLRYTHHAHLRAALNHEESLLWRAHAQVDDNALSPETLQRMRAAETFIDKLAATLTQPNSPRSASVWWTVAQSLVQRVRTDGVFGERYGHLFMPLVATLTSRGHAPPDWADPAQLSDLLDDGQGPTSGYLVRDVSQDYVLLQADPAGPRQSPLGDPFALDAGGVRWRIGEGANARQGWLAARDLPKKLVSLNEPTPVYLETAREALTVAAVERPRGALEWGCHGDGIRVRTPPLGGLDKQWDSGTDAELHVTPSPDGCAWTLETDVATVRLDNTLVHFGLDRQFSVYAEFTISTAHGSATQRLRWIEPGSFLMGSPEDEPERSSDEGPRHWVTLSRGFWLADSACTQALWQAVMGSNPSAFKENAQRPVEQVSWNDVQGFLRRLEALLPGCRADLPTEAEWEYACRAGAETPFSFGEQITPEQVNYNGEHPYAGGKKGLYRQQTVPVKSLPPNAWGLYEMHGNVDEWCADGQR
ncbi:MAG: formylglycine-generating enzyme family protein, partial [Candidatus Competibacter phosphatis]